MLRLIEELETHRIRSIIVNLRIILAKALLVLDIYNAFFLIITHAYLKFHICSLSPPVLADWAINDIASSSTISNATTFLSLSDAGRAGS